MVDDVEVNFKILNLIEMENYTKGKNEEEPLLLTDIPIANIPQDVLWLQVRGGTKMRNVLAHMKKFHENKSDDICCIWTGCGPSVEKAISCAEITKRNYDYKLHQVTKICYKTVHEYWDPINPDLDQLVVTRKVPMVHIYLSSKPLDTSESGYQAPGPFAP
ncbi:ribonuclease P protein subunit p25-like protein isoform X2 [Coccinella septempunctata]|uniref:ribonuclease P protein subunit p25-like protein isoform X2 n=1 Tax=Coccinella septempunctata TaxID=41139 RepID=UPI001D096CB4|nr:ribonuclease P protein subunit p25-like protein isoform X2 [Coccinella septempunctata]